MKVNDFLLFAVNNSFYNAYIQSDLLGKLIFVSLIMTSICCWIIFIHKILLTRKIKKNSNIFYVIFNKQRNNPFNIDNESSFKKEDNPFYELFLILKRQTLEILQKNRRFGAEEKTGSYLSSSDIDSISSHLSSTVDLQTKKLEKNLYILAIIVGLAPLLGLLGTVWGILITFSGLQTHATGSNQMILGGIALALTTTVLGLLSAIPALISHQFLKNSIHLYETEMEAFSNDMLSCVEMQYRKVDK